MSFYCSFSINSTSVAFTVLKFIVSLSCNTFKSVGNSVCIKNNCLVN